MMAVLRFVSLALVLMVVQIASARAFESFVIKDLKIEGLQRIAVGTVLNYLPVNVGDRMDDKRAAATIRALFKTGFFDDVRLGRRRDVLVITVVERPAIAKIELSGNKDIESDQLLDALKNIGLSKGRVFDRSSLDKVEKELERQYFARGKYGVKITSKVTSLKDNRINLAISIAEGGVAQIRRINIVGNQVYTDSNLLSRFQLSGPTILSFLSSSDQYSRRKLSGDLETLRSFYLDRGFINFTIDSTQVSISPDKRNVFVTINVTEGEKYRVREVKLSGELIVAEAELRKLLKINGGDIFSRRRVTETTAATSQRLGEEGFAFANVNTAPDIDKSKREVTLTFFIDPGKRIYVHRINITGNSHTRDKVVRREMRQMESGWISTQKVQRSRVRLQRLGFFDEVNVETPAVPGLADQVDVNFNVHERSSGSLQAGVGFSQGQGLLLNASITQNNIFGTGNRISVNVNNSSVNRIYSFSYNNPYYTIDGISRGFRIFSRSTDAGKANVANYTSDVYGASVNYGIPINENDRASASLGYENTKLNTSRFTPVSFLKFIADNGDNFDIIKLNLAWSHDTRNRAIFPDRGVRRILTADFATPLGNLEFYKLRYREFTYLPLTDDFTLLLRGDIGIGNDYGGTSELPFWERYFAGGISSVRGYKSNSLGPRENGDPRGGALKTVANAEVIFPAPFAAENKSLRLSAFFDIGNVFASTRDFDTGGLRYSAGVAVKWLTPVAPLIFSFAWPLNDESGDDVERFQFSLGASNF